MRPGHRAVSASLLASNRLRLIQQPLCLVLRHAVRGANSCVSWDFGVGRVVRVRDAAVGDGAVVSDCGKWPVLDGLSSCLLQARRVLRANLEFGKVDARLSRDLEGETMLNMSLRSYKLLSRLLPAVFQRPASLPAAWICPAATAR